MSKQWERLTTGSNEQDRIKILWIDDHKENLGTPPQWLARQYGKWFDIYYAAVPEQVGDWLREAAAGASLQYGDAIYRLEGAPFDVYLADWDLSGASNTVLGRPSQAKEAEAAGLTTGTLSACHFPRHPAAVIPYSANWNKLKAYGSLHQSVAPDYLYIAWHEGRQLKADQVPRVLPTVVSLCFRNALAQAARWRHVYFPTQTHAAVQAESRSSTGFCKWLENAHVEFDTAWGRRRIRLKAMWLDLYEPDMIEAPVHERLVELRFAQLEVTKTSPEASLEAVKADLRATGSDELRRLIVTGWFDSMPRWLDGLSSVINLVNHYWLLSLSEKSRLRYRLSAILSTEESQRTTLDQLDAEAICLLMGLRYPDLRHKTVEELRKVSIRNEGWTCPPIYDVQELGDGPEGLVRQRLAVLMLCVLGRARGAEGPIAVDGDWLPNLWVLTPGVDAQLQSGNREEAVKLINAAYSSAVEQDEEEGRQERFVARHLPKSASEYVSRLLNPLPEGLLAPGLTGDGQLGKGLSRRCLSLLDLWNDIPPRRKAAQPFPEAASIDPQLKLELDKLRAAEPPFGFRVQPNRAALPVLLSEPAQSDAVKTIFGLFLSIENPLSFLEAVKADPTIPKRKTHGKDKAWDISSLLSLLQNELHVGVLAIKDVRYKAHAEIVDEALFDQVQAKCYHPSNYELRVLQNWAREEEWSEDRWWKWLKRQIPHD